MSNTTHPFSFTIYPLEWLSPTKVVLYSYGLITTGYTFSASATVTAAGGQKPLGTFSLAATSGFNGVYLGEVHIPDSTAYPLTVSGTITCSSPFATITAPQKADGLKPTGNPPTYIPVSYTASVFCNDSGSDNDWNDLVLNFQLFSQSTD